MKHIISLGVGVQSIELAWAAGFFDGEGNTRVEPSGDGLRRYLRISIGQVEIEPLQRFRHAVNCAGKIYGPYKRGERWREIWTYSARGPEAHAALGAILPYCSTPKRLQAEKARRLSLLPRLPKSAGQKQGGRSVLNIISLGAGVQSSTMALMAAAGEIMPMPDCAIFADTQSEPKAVYDWLDWLEPRLPFPVHRVTAGSLRDEILGAMKGTNRMDARPPFFTSGGGMLNRQCTHDFKLRPIQRKQRELLGLIPRQRWPLHVAIEQWIGISRDEEQRCRVSSIPAINNRWPLIELGLTRADCLKWMRGRGFPEPSKSACTFCPYHDDAMWRDMKLNDPESFADAVAIDEAIRPGVPGPKRPEGTAAWFLHRKRIPLVEIDLRTAEQAGQAAMFDEHGFAVECQGMCGV